MNVHRFRRLCNVNYQSLSKFRYAHAKERTEVELLQQQEAQTTQSSGLTVASLENYSPITKVCVIIKAGCRYETSENQGIVHMLRNCSVLSTKNHTAFSVTRRLESLGVKLGVTSTRECLMYELHCDRDIVDSGLEVVGEILMNPAFKAWEVNDITPQLDIDLAMHKANTHSVLHEAIHKASFRGGLNNSLYSEPYMVGKHTVDMLYAYLNNRFTASNTSIVALGMPHEYLENNVNEWFHFSKADSGSTPTSKFGPGEVRLEADLPFVHSAIVAEGASLANTKDMLSLGVLQCLLGIGPHIDMGTSKFSQIGEAAAKSTSNPFYVSSLNLSYSDAGIFGVYVAGHQNDMKQLIKAILSEMRAVSKNISDQSVEIAKHKLKAKLRLERETSNDALSAMALEVSQFGKIQDVKEIEKAIDDLKTTDIASIAAKVMKAKPAMASLGRLHSTPHVDELI